jgi:small-conductance mechanosensitive channel
MPIKPTCTRFAAAACSPLRLLAFVAACFLACSALAGEADKPPEDKPAVQKPAEPAAVPLSELSAQAEAAAVNLREIAAKATADPALTRIDRELPVLTREIDLRVRENARIISQRPPLELLSTLERNWRRVGSTLELWSSELAARIAALDRDIARLDELDGTWKATLTAATTEQAPAELIARAQTLIAAIGRMSATLDAQLALALRLQSRVEAQAFRVAEAIDSIQQVREATLKRIFERDAPPLWSGDLQTQGEQIVVDSQDSRETQWTVLRNYVQRHLDRLLMHAIVFAILAALLYWVRRRINKWAQEEPGLQRPALVFAWPAATALLLALIGSRWIYPEAPRLMWAIIGAAALAPTVLVVRKLIAPYLQPLLYAVIALYLVDQLRTIAASIELVPRLAFFLEMLGGAGFLLWFMRRMRTTAPVAEGGSRSRPLLTLALRIAFALFLLTTVANATGYLALANLIGNAVLRSMYFGLILYAMVEILDALVIMALRVKPLKMLGMVQRHRELLRQRTRLVINAIAVVLWALFVLERLAVRQQVIAALKEMFTAELTIGSIALSLSDALAFVLAVWASFLFSRFLRFVLEEEVYPHARLKRGLPHAISQTLHYIILVVGFFVAMAALGLDMTKFTILAGAFTVGVGFGLQNIFNNFVSGLILLFERPMQVGDVIQIGDTAGVVERIGIRASIVRTPNGSEIIVPNGKLISEQLVNWTFSDRQRGVEVPVSVVLGSDPQQVIEILESVAKDHPKLVDHPPPRALLTRMGPDWLGFELHAATDRIEDWLEVRSEVGVAVHKALAAAKITLR